MIRWSLALWVLLLLAIAPAAADETDRVFAGSSSASPPSVFRLPSQSLSGILDPTKLSLSNSVSFVYASGSGRAGMSGLYQNRLSYQLADPLTLTVLLGYEYTSPLRRTFGEPDEGGRFLPGFTLSYRPSDKFLMRVQYRTVPSLYQAGSWGESLWLRDPFENE
ncbi:MAG: hypothetical protein JW958_14750 [Candidatus Eisenbacteria bacterium]|nr:hypothetical protein [Candidatus Eisenbacteria bacterium]